MLQNKNLSQEPHFSAYLELLRNAILHIRMWIRYNEEIPKEKLHDLTDAIHNIPEFLYSQDSWHNEKRIREDLERYDSKWGDHETQLGSYHLLQTVDSYLEEAKKRLEK